MGTARSLADRSKETRMLERAVCAAIVGAGAMLAGCGYTDFEMAAKQRQIDALVAEVHALKATAAPACRVNEQQASLRPRAVLFSSR
jgi:hypothetical protein